MVLNVTHDDETDLFGPFRDSCFWLSIGTWI